LLITVASTIHSDTVPQDSEIDLQTS